jgi:hypothetical protein
MDQSGTRGHRSELTMLRTLAIPFLLIALVASAAAIEDCPYFSIDDSQEELAQPLTPMWVGPGDTLYGYYVHDNRVRRSVDHGETWEIIHQFPGESSCNGFFVDSRGTIFASRPSPDDNPTCGKLQMGRYEGASARVWSEPLSFECGEGFWKMTEDLDGNLFIGEYAGDWYDTCAFIWRSTDEGTEWEKVYDGTGRHVHFVACDPYTGKLYAAVGDGYDRARLLRSEDAGDNWDVILEHTLHAQPISIAFTPTHRVFGSDWGDGLWPWNSIYRTEDDVTFVEQLVFSGEENTFVWTMSANAAGTIFAGTVTKDSGGENPAIYMSYDGGQFWCKAKDLGTVPDGYRGIPWISNFDSAGYAYFHDSEAYKSYRFSGEFPLTVTPTASPLARLGEPSPNPFHGSTRVAFEVGSDVGTARLAVYDLRGRLVRTLVSGTVGGGRHAATWDGRDGRGRAVPSGVYFVRLEVGGEARGRKLLLLK